MKAVILAGGEGKRLRPLTDHTPKPMVPLFSEPVLFYLLSQLEKCGVEEAIIALRFLPEVIPHAFGETFKHMKLHYRTEESPRGTAGAVKDAAKGFDEPFFIVSGDGVCDFDFNGILTYHKAAGSQFTVVCHEVRQPGEYGLVKKSEDNRILSFIEKPGWNRTDGNLANTGVYICDPAVLDLIADDGMVDFAADVFPILLQNQTPFYAYQESGYWCDIGDPESYKACHRAAFDGEIDLSLPQVQKDVYSPAEIPSGSYTIIPPVWFGEGVSVGKDAVIGPYTVIGDGCTVQGCASVRKSVLQNKVFCGEGALVSDSILCEGVSVKKDCRIFEQAVIGANTVIGAGSTVGSNVYISSDKNIAKNSIISENISEGFQQPQLPENGDWRGAAFTEISVKSAAALGAAFGSAKSGKYIAVGSDGKNSSDSILSAICGGLISAGANIWHMGRSFCSQFLYMLTYSGMNGGVYVSTEAGEVSISLRGEHALPPDRKTERDCAYRFRRSDFTPCNPEHCGSVRDMSYLIPMYRRQLGLFKNEYYGGRSFHIASENQDIRDFCREFFGRHCVEEEGLPTFHIARDGMKMTLTDELGELASYESLLVLCCYDAFMQGSDVAVPYDAPKVINRLAAEKGCHVIRYCDEDDTVNPEAAKLIADCVWSRDALFMCVKLLDMSIRYATDLHGLLQRLPVFFVYEKSLSVPGEGAFTGEILRRFGEESDEKTGVGVRLSGEKGDVLLTAASQGQRIRILTEAENEETAIELCGEMEDKICAMMNQFS